MMFMHTRTGKRVNLLVPEPDTICIEDIACHLSRINRFLGATKYPYTVAEHCVLCSRLAPEGTKFPALMHDAAEAYIGDITRPVRMLMPDSNSKLLQIESALMRVIGRVFDFETPVPIEVDVIENKLCFWELQELVDEDAHIDRLDCPVEFHCWPAERAEREFLEVFHLLDSARENPPTHSPDNGRAARVC